MGIGNTSSAALLAHKLTGEPLVQIIGRGTGLDDKGLQNKQRLLEVAARRTTDKLSAELALQEYGGFEVATMVGAMLGAAASGRLVIVDGYIATAATLVAVQLRPEMRDYCIFAHDSAETGHLLTRRVFEKKLGGYTGDCLGATQQVSEIGLYLGLLICV
jgi:nicotinate-nucleotide--dimethylbenzimidazole phosphoribosyltransferase